MNEGRKDEELENISLLGNQNTKYKYDHPSADMFETFKNKHPDNNYLVNFRCYEFTSLCPVTGQPDFATVNISYIPNEDMVESKSLKLYLFSFRNHGDFHEDCTNIILNDLVKTMKPKYCRVITDFTPRGGISIDTIAEYTQPKFDVPKHYLVIPEIFKRCL